jgi:hypothetical protein
MIRRSPLASGRATRAGPRGAVLPGDTERKTVASGETGYPDDSIAPGEQLAVVTRGQKGGQPDWRGAWRAGVASERSNLRGRCMTSQAFGRAGDYSPARRCHFGPASDQLRDGH